mmetsp:Transcript_23180/g.38852  ORF Transcript_23180/g.38852 Transcript_23180/m.38852 type:complete len:249 (+) Transcript_23180:1583-2329(+)
MVMVARPICPLTGEMRVISRWLRPVEYEIFSCETVMTWGWLLKAWRRRGAGAAGLRVIKTLRVPPRGMTAGTSRLVTGSMIVIVTSPVQEVVARTGAEKKGLLMEKETGPAPVQETKTFPPATRPFPATSMAERERVAGPWTARERGMEPMNSVSKAKWRLDSWLTTGGVERSSSTLRVGMALTNPATLEPTERTSVLMGTLLSILTATREEAPPTFPVPRVPSVLSPAVQRLPSALRKTEKPSEASS